MRVPPTEVLSESSIAIAAIHNCEDLRIDNALTPSNGRRFKRQQAAGGGEMWRKYRLVCFCLQHVREKVELHPYLYDIQKAIRKWATENHGIKTIHSILLKKSLRWRCGWKTHTVLGTVRFICHLLNSLPLHLLNVRTSVSPGQFGVPAKPSLSTLPRKQCPFLSLLGAMVAAPKRPLSMAALDQHARQVWDGAPEWTECSAQQGKERTYEASTYSAREEANVRIRKAI